MRYFFLTLVLFSGCLGYGQERRCAFPRDSIIMVDSITSLQMMDTIKSIPLKKYNLKGRIPAFIKEVFSCWLGEKFRIANRGWPYEATDAIGPFSWPRRQLMYLGFNDHYLLISYKHGGLGFNCPTMLFRFENEKILSVWYWVGFSETIWTKEDILQYYGQRYPNGWQSEWPNL